MYLIICKGRVIELQNFSAGKDPLVFSLDIEKEEAQR